MADNPYKLPKGYTKADIQLLKAGCEYYYPVVVFGEVNLRAFGQGKFGPWKDSSEFKKDLFKVLPSVEDMKEVHLILESWEKIAPETITPDEQPERTTPEKEKLEAMQKEAEEREKAAREADLRAKQQTEQQINTLREKAAAKGKVVYLEPKLPKQVQLSPEEELAKSKFEEAANDPRTFLETFSKKIIEKISPETKNNLTNDEIKVAADQVAIDFLNRITQKDTLKNLSTGVFKSLLESNLVPSELKEINATLPILSMLSATSEGVTRSFLYPLVGKNLTDYYYDEPEKEFIVTSNPTPNSEYQVNLEKLTDDFATFRNNPVFSFLEGKVKEKLVEHGKQVFVDYVAKLPTKGILGFVKSFTTNSALTSGLQILTGAGVTYQATNLTGWALQIAVPDLVPVLTFAAQKFGVNVGLTTINALTPAATGALEAGAIVGSTTAGGVASATVAGTGAVAAGAAAATTVATTATGAAVGTGAGATVGAAASTITGPFALIIGPILAAVGAVVGKVVEKVKIWLKRNPNAIKYLTLLPVIVGVATGSVVLITVGGVLFVGTFVLTGGIATAGTAAAGFLVTTIGIITGAALTSYAKRIVLILIGIVAFGALVFFIINSGAYIVPPDTGSTNTNSVDQNPYISVTKVADKTSAPNPSPTLTVNYTVTVSAPQGSITNLVFQNGCNVIKNGSIPTCTAPLPEKTPEIIDPTAPFVFTYSQTYDTSYSNSLITDTFSVTATTPLGQGNSVSSASVVVGNPPTSCFNVAGNNWPAARKANILSAIATLSGSFPAYTAKLCSGGQIKVVYDTTKNPSGWGFYSGGTLYFNGRGGLDSTTNALYILAHETGHHFQSSTLPGIAAMVLYANNTSGVASERPLCSYVNTGNAYEAFAEAIALYVTHDQSSQWTNYCGGTFQSTYPNHYNFVKNFIF